MRQSSLVPTQQLITDAAVADAQAKRKDLAEAVRLLAQLLEQCPGNSVIQQMETDAAFLQNAWNLVTDQTKALYQLRRQVREFIDQHGAEE